MKCIGTKFALRTAGLAAGLAALASGAEPASAQEIFEFHTGVRQLGMGGAYTAVVNDETAILSNPAGLGKIRDLTVTIADPELHGSFNDFEIAKLDNVTRVFSAQGLMEVLNENRGKHWHGKFQAFPSVITPNFGLGLLMKYSIDAEVDDTGTTYRLDYTNDYAGALGYCFRFFSGLVKIGVNAKVINRVEIHKDLPTTSTGLEVSNLASEGLGVGSDVGMIITAPVALLPTISAVLRDVGGTAYTLADGAFHATAERPAPTPQTLDAGFALYPILSNHVRMTFTAEMHDVLNVNEVLDPMKRIHAGAEMNFADFFFLRAGMNQRYWTAGIELASERFQLQAASYGEEIGTSDGTTYTMKEDRRWVGKFGIRF